MAENPTEERRAIAKTDLETKGGLDIVCLGCGKAIRLWFNSGELDDRICCGRKYALEVTGYELVVRKVGLDGD